MLRLCTGLLLCAIISLGECSSSCHICSGASTMQECLGQTTNCSDTEECFLSMGVNANGGTTFNAGCRSKTVCQLMASLAVPAGKRSAGLITCNKCCVTQPWDNNPCNAALCGQAPPPANECYFCDSIASVASCTHTHFCQDTEICSSDIIMVGNTVKYSLGCVEKHKCKAMIQNGIIDQGKRSIGNEYLTLCSSCCYGNKCNRADCFHIRKNMSLANIGADH